MFNANSGQSARAYQRVGVESLVDSANPQRLVLMLFDGARVAVTNARMQMKGGNTGEKGKAISQAIAIIDDGLRASLDLKAGGTLAKNLSDLYAYMTLRLLHANLKNDIAALEEVSMLLEQLGGAWETIGSNPTIGPLSPADAVRSVTNSINRSGGRN